jgi:hypothetical protein
MKRAVNSPSFYVTHYKCSMCAPLVTRHTPGGSTSAVPLQNGSNAGKEFLRWNIRGVYLLLQCGVHSEKNAGKNRRVTSALCGGIGSFRTLVVCVNGKARGDQACLMKQWRE